MSIKRIAIATGALVALAVIGVTIDRMTNSHGESGAGQTLLGDVDLSKAKMFTIRKDKDQVTLRPSDAGWVIAEYADFPANEDQLRKLAFQLAESVLEHKVTERKEKLGDLGALTMEENEGKFTPDVTGAELIVTGEGETPLLHLVAGNSRSSGAGFGGQYIRRKAETVAYLISDALEIPAKPSDWLPKKIFDFDAGKNLKGISIVRAGKPNLVFGREDEKSAWVNKGSQIKQFDVNKVKRMAQDTASFGLAGLAQPGQSPKQLGRTRLAKVELSLLDKRVYRIEIGEDKAADGNRYLVVSAELPTDVSDAELKQKVADFNARFGKRVVAVYDWEGEAVLKVAKDFMVGEDKH